MDVVGDLTPGLFKQAFAQNSPLLGTANHIRDIVTTVGEKNYNCEGMVGIDAGGATPWECGPEPPDREDPLRAG